MLAKTFADGVPEEEFSVAGLQGCEFSFFFCNFFFLFFVGGVGFVRPGRMTWFFFFFSQNSNHFFFSPYLFRSIEA